MIDFAKSNYLIYNFKDNMARITNCKVLFGIEIKINGFISAHIHTLVSTEINQIRFRTS